jgi:tetratricopeptide (TPR) repeat protein
MNFPLTNALYALSFALTIFMLLFTVRILPRVILKWETVRRHYGCVPWGLARQMICYGKKSRVRWILQMTFVTLLVSAAFIVRRLIHDDPWQFTAMWLAALAFAVVKLCEAATPPTILFLGASSALSAQTMARLNKALPYCRTTSLVDPRVRLTHEEVGAFYWNDLRTTNTYEWRSVVYHLMDVVPVIVIDSYTSTHWVREELSRLEQKGYLDRTGYLIDDGAPPPSDGWMCVTREALPDWVREQLQRNRDHIQRMARQKEFDAIFAAMPRSVRAPQSIKMMVVKAQCIQQNELRRFVRVCKGIDPDDAADDLLEDIPSHVARAEEIRFLRESRAFEEVEILLRSALEEVEHKDGATQAYNTANSYNKLGVLARLRCDWPEAERLIMKAITKLDALRENGCHDPQVLQELATAHYNLGEVWMARYRETGTEADRQQARSQLSKSVRLDREIGGDISRTVRRLESIG